MALIKPGGSLKDQVALKKTDKPEKAQLVLKKDLDVPEKILAVLRAARYKELLGVQ